MLLILIPLFLLALLLTGIVMWSTSGSGGSEMSCGRCGYSVRGLTQLNCPECGADLREAGIRLPGSPGKRMAGIWLTLGSAGVLLLGCLFSMVFLMSDRSSQPVHAPTLQPSMTQPQQNAPQFQPLHSPDDVPVEAPEVESQEVRE